MTGLSPGQRVTISLAGRRARNGRADERGVAHRKVRVSGYRSAAKNGRFEQRSVTVPTRVTYLAR